MSCRPSDIIKSSAMREVVNYRDGDTEDIITTIRRMDLEAHKYIDADAAQCLLGQTEHETLYNVWAFVKNNVRYVADRSGREVVKSPAALFTMKKGDCKSFSIAEAAILKALGFKNIKYRFAGYGRDRNVTHVYIVVKSGGRNVILDAVHSRFDEEVPYKFKKEIPAHTAGIQGIYRPAKGFTRPYFFIGMGLIIYAVTR